MPWDKILYALIIGISEFVNAMDGSVDVVEVGKKANNAVAKNRAAEAAAEKKEDDVFTSVKNGDK